MPHYVRLAMLSGLLAASLPAVAHAGACEDTFERKGSAISGLRFVATVSLNDLPPEVAINQMRGIAARGGYDIIASEPMSGALLIEQSMSNKARAFPIEINATQVGGTGTVRMEAKLRAAMSAPLEGARTEMCGMLAQLRGGREGRLAAASGEAAITQQGAPIAISAQEFSQQISKDAERNALVIPQRYANKRFTLSGTMDHVMRDGAAYNVGFKILQPHELVLRLPGMARSLANVRCLMAQGTSVFVMQLKPGNGLRLTGTFHEYSEDRQVVWFKDCVPERGR